MSEKGGYGIREINSAMYQKMIANAGIYGLNFLNNTICKNEVKGMTFLVCCLIHVLSEIESLKQIFEFCCHCVILTFEMKVKVPNNHEFMR